MAHLLISYSLVHQFCFQLARCGFWNGVRLNAGKVPFPFPLFFTVSHVFSLTTPETEQVIVCLVCVVVVALLAFGLLAFDLHLLDYSAWVD